MDVSFVTSGPRDGHGGINRYVDHLERSLVAEGVTVRTASLRYLPGARHRSVLKSLPIGLERSGPGTIYHFPQILGSPALFDPRVRPAVVTVHDLGALYCPEDLASATALGKALFRIGLAAMRRADQIIAVSSFTRDCLLRAGFPSNRITVIHEAADLERFHPRPQALARLAERYGIDPHGPPIILYVGNELPRKNLGTLVEALAIVKRTHGAVRWFKVGAPLSAPSRATLERHIEQESLTSCVQFFDRVPDNDLPLFYAAASLYVQPSLWEGFGLPVIEAMACGTPVVASRAAALPEICGDAALLVDARSADTLAAGITAALTDPALRERLRAAGLERAAIFTWAKTAAQTRQVYARVAAQVAGA